MRLVTALLLAAVALVDSPRAGAPSRAVADDAAGDGASAATGQACRVVEMNMTPAAGLQMVAWIEDPAGNYVDTAYITRATGSLGLGNRPGIVDFNSGPLWPYGRRITTFPVWASRHGMTWPTVAFQDGEERDLSHPLGESSRENSYCRPIRPDESLWDATSCATVAYTDKGRLDDSMDSKYPPRADLSYTPGRDDPSIENMASLNPFDAVSHATPPGDSPYTAAWAVPRDLPNGDYVLWLEVSKEFDQNATYQCQRPECGNGPGCDLSNLPDGCPAETDPYCPPCISYGQYGEAYKGQPSILYKVPFTLTDQRTTAETLDYVGYGDPQGLDGMIRSPDGTITTAADRLSITVDGADMFRLRVAAYPSDDNTGPDAPGHVAIDEMTGTTVTAHFDAPGDDGLDGTVAGYEVRYVAGDAALDADTFDQAAPATFDLKPVAGGTLQSIVIDELLPRTHYTFGIRAHDECDNVGPLTVFDVTTPRPESGSVDACFVATAAYGSLLAESVTALRAFRDAALRTHVTGELAVEGYYTFGPLLAHVIAPSDTLRRAARAALAPLVHRVRAAGF